jgi:hypothetical protein
MQNFIEMLIIFTIIILVDTKILRERERKKKEMSLSYVVISNYHSFFLKSHLRLTSEKKK